MLLPRQTHQLLTIELLATLTDIRENTLLQTSVTEVAVLATASRSAR